MLETTIRLPEPPLLHTVASRPERRSAGRHRNGSSALEHELWRAANVLRGKLDAAAFKQVLLGLVFLRYASEGDPRTRLRVPKHANWTRIVKNSAQTGLGARLNDAMRSIQRENPELRDSLPEDFERPELPEEILMRTVFLVDRLTPPRQPETNSTDHFDFLGRTYEYLLAEFASAEGRRGGEFYTPESVVALLVTMLRPWQGVVYDPCCGAGGMFVKSHEFVRRHRDAGRFPSISVMGQESNHSTWRLARMNLAMHGISGDIAFGDTLLSPAHGNLAADFVLANPPFNVSSWRNSDSAIDKRWQYGVPPASNANYAWLQHITHSLGPNGVAGVVLANGSLHAGGTERVIRQRMIEADLVDCIVALPGNLFYSTPIPTCIWVLARNRATPHDRRGRILFLDARHSGVMADRTHRVLEDIEIAEMADRYAAFRDGIGISIQQNRRVRECIVGLQDLQRSQFDLSPGRYVPPPMPATASRSRLDEVASTLKATSADFGSNLNAVLKSAHELTAYVDHLSEMPGSTSTTLGSLVTAPRNLVSPNRNPDQRFDLYSIPAYDATGLPEQTVGANILSAKLTLEPPALLVSRLNPQQPRVWFVDGSAGSAVCSTEFSVLRPLAAHLLEFLYLYCCSTGFRDYFVARVTGSTGSRQRVHVRDLLAAPVWLPSDEDLRRLDCLARPLRAWRNSLPIQHMLMKELSIGRSDLFGQHVRQFPCSR